MVRRIPAGAEILPGVTLHVSTMGGYSVHLDRQYIGWIHAFGAEWNATLRVPGELGRSLGRHGEQADAVTAVVTAHTARTPQGQP